MEKILQLNLHAPNIRGCRKLHITMQFMTFFVGECRNVVLFGKIELGGTTMKKIQSLIKKYSCNAMAFMLTTVAVGIATCGCYFVYYQPEVPENLKKFSKNR